MPATNTGLSPSDWVTLGVFIATGIGGFFWWLWQRFLKKVERLHDDLHGKNGVVADLNLSMEGIRRRYGEFVVQEEFDVQLSHLDGHIKELQREGVAREQQILKAIERMDERAREDQKQLRNDLGGIHKRIDHILSRGPQGH